MNNDGSKKHLEKKRERSKSSEHSGSGSSSEIVKTKKTKHKPVIPDSDEDSGIQVTKDEISISLDKKKKVTIRKFKGQVYVDIREFYEKDGEKKPGKKGIALTPNLWEKLKSRSKDIDDAIKNMK